MLGSPHIKPNKAEATAWESALLTVQSTLEEWLAVQRSWLYLQVRRVGWGVRARWIADCTCRCGGGRGFFLGLQGESSLV
jgi:hypothetical protein